MTEDPSGRLSHRPVQVPFTPPPEIPEPAGYAAPTVLYSLDDGRPIGEAVPTGRSRCPFTSPQRSPNQPVMPLQPSFTPSMTEDPSGRLSHRPVQVSFTPPQRSPNQPVMPLQPSFTPLDDGRPIGEAVPQAGPGVLHSTPEISEPAGYAAPTVLYSLEDGRPIREAVPTGPSRSPSLRPRDLRTSQLCRSRHLPIYLKLQI